MMILLGAGLAPAWAVLPVAMLTLLVVAAHVLLLVRADMPPSRRRIRAASGVLMMATLPVAVYALVFADPVIQQREFVLSWMLTTAMVLLVLLLAIVDIVNTWRLKRVEAGHLRRLLREARALETAADANALHPPSR